MSQLKLLWTWEWKNKEEDHLEIKRHKHCLGPIANKTFRGLDVVHLQKEAYCSVHFSDILILLIPYRYLTSLLTDMYIHVAVTASPSFLPGSTPGRMFIPDMAAIITASTWAHFFSVEQDGDNWCNESPHRFLGTLLTDSSTCAYFNYRNSNLLHF